MFPIVEVPESIQEGMLPYRSVFCRQEGFESVSRFVTGLIISPNKTLQGIYDLQNWGREAGPSRRSMHEAVFEAHWDDDRLMEKHRAEVAKAQSQGGRQIISLDWTLAHHILWDGQWQAVRVVAAQLRTEHPDAFRPVTVRLRNGKTKTFWA